MPHQCFALFSCGPLRTSIMSESCDLRGLPHCVTLGFGLALKSPSWGAFSWPGDECVVAFPITLRYFSLTLKSRKNSRKRWSLQTGTWVHFYQPNPLHVVSRRNLTHQTRVIMTKIYISFVFIRASLRHKIQLAATVMYARLVTINEHE